MTASHAATDGVLSSASILVDNHLDYFRQQVKAKLSEMHIEPDVEGERAHQCCSPIPTSCSLLPESDLFSNEFV